MDTPIAAILWPEHARREPQAMLRMLEMLERRCLEMGAEEAAEHLSRAVDALLRDQASRRRAA